jgi:RNA polymerase sigma factor (TIGR02999 family)
MPSSLTDRLRAYSKGDREMADAILSEILPELRKVAARALKNDRHSAFSPTDLVNEVWLRKLHVGGWDVKDRQHFYLFAGRAMRQVLIDMARNRLAKKRGDGSEPVSLEEFHSKDPATTSSPENIIHLGLLIERLEEVDGDAARMVDLHYFAGFTLQEIAEKTGLTFRQARSRWERGRDWLKKQIKDRR